VVSFTPHPFYLREQSPRYSFDRKLVGAQSQSGRGGEEKKNPCPYRESNPGRPARSLVTNITFTFLTFSRVNAHVNKELSIDIN